MLPHPDPAADNGKPAIRNTLYLQVLVGIVLGAILGYVKPAWGVELKPLGDAFVNLVKMLIGPIIFTTVVVGLAGMALILGVDRFMSEARAITNFIGNTVATLIVSKWEGALDETKAGEILARRKAQD
ncbi:MAG: cation:dicarboxylase symporter family transporter [Verrucomicrobia bacterium]|nr:cation:dicarboxylase symporter family transporter [Verrucomicrobiota bacterium]